MTWCGACGVQFALPTIIFQSRARDGLSVFCPCCGNAGLCEAPAEDVLGQLQQQLLQARHELAAARSKQSAKRRVKGAGQ